MFHRAQYFENVRGKNSMLCSTSQSTLSYVAKRQCTPELLNKVGTAKSIGSMAAVYQVDWPILWNGYSRVQGQKALISLAGVKGEFQSKNYQQMTEQGDKS
jgi:hypothetical protein